MAELYKGISSDNIKGLVLALSSSFFIGASFIVKKKGLKKVATSGLKAGKKKKNSWFFPLLLVFWVYFFLGFC